MRRNPPTFTPIGADRTALRARDAAAQARYTQRLTVPESFGQGSLDPSLAADSVPGVGALIAGKYRIEGSLGAGGMGVVLAARHEAIGQPVAIKLLVVGDEEYRAEASVRLLREARAVASLRGEHVVRVFDVGELSNGTPFIVMERLDGHDLSAILRRVGPLSIPIALALIVQACHAVAEAHRAGIVHRDLKPSNLFVVRRSDGSAWLKVLDFGISKSMRPSSMESRTLTGARMALGSPRYMSPEQVRDAHAVDHRSDVWSLGVILYELVSGHPVFQAASYSGIYAAIVADSPPSLASVCPAASPELVQVVGRCLTRDLNARIQSVDELRALLEPFAAKAVDFAALATFDSAPASLAVPRPERSPFHPPAATTGESAALNARTPSSAVPRASSGVISIPRPERSMRPLSEPMTRRSTSDEVLLAAPRADRRFRYLALGLLLPLGLLLWFTWPGPAKGTAPLPSSSTTRGGVLSIVSVPPGARVSEGDLVYGVTPLQLSLSSGEAAKVRFFKLELPGYRPHVFEQRPVSGSGSVQVRVSLVAERAEQNVNSVSTGAAHSPRPVSRSVRPRRAAPDVAPAHDIRLSR